MLLQCASINLHTQQKGNNMKNLKPAPELMMGQIMGFGHIVENIYLFWGCADLNEYLEKMLTKDSAHRQGFPDKVIFEIADVLDAHKKQFPHFVRKELMWA